MSERKHCGLPVQQLEGLSCNLPDGHTGMHKHLVLAEEYARAHSKTVTPSADRVGPLTPTEGAIREAVSTSTTSPATPSAIKHGVDCPKAAHLPMSSYMHDATDDKPYDVDGVLYCGRCHEFLPAATQEPSR